MQETKQKISFLALLTHLREALAAVDRAVRLGLKGNSRLTTASGTNSREILTRAAGGILARIAASLAALGLILETALCVKFLLTSGEHKFLAALFAH